MCSLVLALQAQSARSCGDHGRTGLSLAHTTILRWVRRYAPKFVKRWNRFGTPTGQSWRVDETYLKVRGRWGQPPKTITLDGYAASHRAVREMKEDGLLPEDTKVRCSKYLNNLIEQDHPNIKCHARFQTLQERSDHVVRHRVDATHSQRPV